MFIAAELIVNQISVIHTSLVNMNRRAFFENLLPAILFAFGGTLLSTAVVGGFNRSLINGNRLPTRCCRDLSMLPLVCRQQIRIILCKTTIP
ncbi:hypothetical protein T492DRAFT_970502, partial [Pavlovales sp. CCMP2436]